MFPPKLHPSDGVRVIAPSCSLLSLSDGEEALARAKAYFTELGMTVSEGARIREMDALESSPISSRIHDLHAAFADSSVQAIIPIRGGWSANQLLRHIDYELLRSHPKILCGFSDITALGNAIYAKTGMVTYSGPNFYNFGFGPEFQYTYDAFADCLLRDGPYRINPSAQWTNERYSSEHPHPQFMRNEGYWVLQEGKAEGTLLGGNLCTLNLLQGTEYMPDLRGSVLFLEDDHESIARTFDRDLQSLLHLAQSADVRGLVIGRFQPESKVTRELLQKIVDTKQELRALPIIANVDFGHTHPLITFPIGGRVSLEAKGDSAMIEILEH